MPPGNSSLKLVELQAFPSLYAYQPVLARTFMDVYGLDQGLRYLLEDSTQRRTSPCCGAPSWLTRIPRT